MGGLFGIVGNENCVKGLYYGTDYHSHLGTMRGGMAVKNTDEYKRVIHDITNAQFRSKFEGDLNKMHGNSGIGVISDTDDQPLLVNSHLGRYAIATVGKINNIDELARKALSSRKTHFSEMGSGEISPTELVATLINEEKSFENGIEYVGDVVKGSCSMLLLTEKGIYAGRDRLGRTPLIVGKRNGSYAITSETCAFPNLNFEFDKDLGPGEVVLIKPDGIEQKKTPKDKMQMCSFLWVYYGYPSSAYEGINVEMARYNCGAALAKRDLAEGFKPDVVAGIPDSGTAHALGYSNQAGVPHVRPFVKYTPTWPRSFMPQNQDMRDLVADMKLQPIKELVQGKSILFCEDSIVRGTQLKRKVRQLFDEFGAKEVHMRPACPPLIYSCDFLNFSRSKSVMDLAGIRAVAKLEGTDNFKQEILKEYANPDTEKHQQMVKEIEKELGLTSLKYQRLDDLVKAIGLDKDTLCKHCWDGQSFGHE